jgi:hypothetical protein
MAVMDSSHTNKRKAILKRIKIGMSSNNTYITAQKQNL